MTTLDVALYSAGILLLFNIFFEDIYIVLPFRHAFRKSCMVDRALGSQFFVDIATYSSDRHLQWSE
jgi:hypothetical protein